MLTSIPAAAEPGLEPVAGVAPEGFIQVTGVGAGEFQPQWWEAGTLNLNFDARAPLLEPREGPFRNIYAPSAVRTEDGWLSTTARGMAWTPGTIGSTSPPLRTS